METKRQEEDDIEIYKNNLRIKHLTESPLLPEEFGLQELNNLILLLDKTNDILYDTIKMLPIMDKGILRTLIEARVLSNSEILDICKEMNSPKESLRIGNIYKLLKGHTFMYLMDNFYSDKDKGIRFEYLLDSLKITQDTPDDLEVAKILYMLEKSKVSKSEMDIIFDLYYKEKELERSDFVSKLRPKKW
jgi:hypothetical protein